MLMPPLFDGEGECTILRALPVAPSVNKIYRNVPGRGRVKSREYKNWLDHAGLLITTQRPKKVAGTYALHIRAQRKNKRADLDNIIKATSDLIVAMGIVADDSLCRRIEAEWIGEGEEMTVSIIATQ